MTNIAIPTSVAASIKDVVYKHRRIVEMVGLAIKFTIHGLAKHSSKQKSSY